MNQIEIAIYRNNNGNRPFLEWESHLDTKTKAIIRTRLERIRLGNLGQTKQLKGADGVWELVVDFGPGYRVYFGKRGTSLIILLAGGEKKSQSRDIAKAKKYWKEYQELL